MASNPHVKPLKGFDPKTALAVDESFASLMKSGDDMLGDELDDFASETPGAGNAGKECGALRTGGAIHSGFAKIELKSGRIVFAATNLKGELFFFEPAGEGLKVSGKIMLQGSLYSPLFTMMVSSTVLPAKVALLPWTQGLRIHRVNLNL